MRTGYKEELAKRIKQHNETVYLTVGYRWKHPTIMDKPLTPDEAIEWVWRMAGHFAKVELCEREDKLCMNAYTTNDML